MKDRDTGLPGDLCDITPFFVGDWRIEPALKLISRGEESFQIEPRIMHVLVCLASRPGQVVSRWDLLDVVWSEAVVNEEGLTHAISQLRRVLGDDPKSPLFIQTIHKSGYRLIAQVTRDKLEPARAGSPDPGVPSPRRPSRPRLAAILGGVAVLVILISVVASISRSRSPVRRTPVALEEVPFTSYPGREIHPAISPDGTRIVFSWKEQEGDDYDIFLKQRNTETPLRLTDAPGDECDPAWSPDGTELAYVSEAEGEIAIYAIPAIGGTPRKLLGAQRGIAGIDWSPDGRLLVYAAVTDASQPFRIVLLSLETGQSRVLTTPVPLSLGDLRPVFSPDGRRIAFVRGDRTSLHDIFVVPVDGGEPAQITHSQHYVASVDWMPDGETLIFSAGPSQVADLRLWKVSLKNGSLTWLPTTSHRPRRLSVASKAIGLVYEEQTINSSILKIGIGEKNRGVVPIIESTRHDYGPQYSPGGRFISFISTRSGSPQIWICGADGTDPRPLTKFEGAYIENPCWSYDERRVAFSAAEGNCTAIYIAEVESGKVQCVASSSAVGTGREPDASRAPGGHERCLGWSRDDQWLYSKLERDGAWWVRKMRSDGSQVIEIMERDVFRLAESSNGKRLIYSRADTSGVWSASLTGADETCVINAPGRVVPCGWREVPGGIYFFNLDADNLNLLFRDAMTGKVAVLASGGDFRSVNIDVSPTGDAVLFDRQEAAGSDLTLVERF